MAEPHELEERAALALCKAGKETCGLESNNCRRACKGCLFEARAVLVLVRVLQTDDEFIGHPTLRDWWLSHTAPQEK